MDKRRAGLERLKRAVESASPEPLLRKARRLRLRLFTQQLGVIDDPARRKAVLCPRRAGKSFTFAAYLATVCLENANANCVFVAITRVRSQDILWNVLKKLNDEFELGMEFGEARLLATFSNGSRIRLAGCENAADVDKFRGEAYHLVILDEAASWAKALFDDMMTQAIEPALGDYEGTLVMGGTPGKVLAGPFYEATGQNATAIFVDEEGVTRARSRPYDMAEEDAWADVTFEWSLHRWDTKDNTSPQGQSAWKAALDSKKRHGWGDDNPIWLRESVGRWIANSEDLVFSYLPDRDDWTPGRKTGDNPYGLPEGHAWRYVIGCDLGYSDPFALQVGAYSDTHPNLYQVYEYEATGLTVGAIADAVKRVIALVGEEFIEAMVADLQGLGGMVVETLAVEHDVCMDRMEQKDKRDHVELVNSDLSDGRVKILADSKLSEEMLYLAWDARGVKTKASQSNHQCDAWLGVARRARHREAKAPMVLPKPGTTEFIERTAELEEHHAARAAQVRAREADEQWQTRTQWQQSDWFSDG